MVPQNPVFSENSGVLGADIRLLFPLLRSCYFRSSGQVARSDLAGFISGMEREWGRGKRGRRKESDWCEHSDFPTHPLSHHIYLVFVPGSCYFLPLPIPRLPSPIRLSPRPPDPTFIPRMLQRTVLT